MEGNDGTDCSLRVWVSLFQPPASFCLRQLPPCLGSNPGGDHMCSGSLQLQRQTGWCKIDPHDWQAVGSLWIWQGCLGSGCEGRVANPHPSIGTMPAQDLASGCQSQSLPACLPAWAGITSHLSCCLPFHCRETCRQDPPPFPLPSWMFLWAGGECPAGDPENPPLPPPSTFRWARWCRCFRK